MKELLQNNTSMKSLIFTLLLGCLYSSCSFNLPDPDYHLKLKNWKQVIDEDVAAGVISAHSVAALNKEQDIDCYFQLYQNDDDNLLMASEVQIWDNNPSDTVLVYYFDEYERMFALQVKIAIEKDSLFNSVTAFYNHDMEVISKDYAIVDNCNVPVRESEDTLFVDLSYFNVPSDVQSFVKKKNIFLRNR